MNDSRATLSADTRSIRVVKKEGKAAGFVYGSICYYSFRNGWKFVSCVPHRRGSRKHYATPLEAFPSWLKRSEVVFQPKSGFVTESDLANLVLPSSDTGANQ